MRHGLWEFANNNFALFAGETKACSVDIKEEGLQWVGACCCPIRLIQIDGINRGQAQLLSSCCAHSHCAAQVTDVNAVGVCKDPAKERPQSDHAI